MLHAGRRNGRLFSLALSLALALALASWATQARAQTPALTTVSDTVFRADGSPASGTLLISWPAFTTADGHTVAAGNKSVALGTNGNLTVQLAPNAGATPSGTTYLVTYQLSDATVKTENWSVGSTSPETISQVRTLVGTSTPLTQVATQQYVNSALANVVHLSGSETITGSKQFTVSPVLPTPSQSGQAVNKAYVDASVANSGGGSFVSKAGDTMTGPLSLPADPTSPNQAADKHYVDVNAASKADLVAGHVPVGELASGVANNSACLHGDSTWGGCGTGSGGSGLTPGMLAIKYATDFTWTQSPSADLSAAGAKTVTLTACAPGVSGAEPQYYVYVSGTGTAEAVLVTGGTCTGNGQTGTLQFTTANPHAAGYTVGSASGGLQEALVAARFTPSNPTGSSQSGKVIVPPGELKAFARISVRASNITVDFSGSVVECWMNDTCIFVGDAINVNVPSRSAVFQAIATDIQLTVHDFGGEHSLYQIQLAAAFAEKLSFEFDATKTSAALNVTPVTSAQVGTTVLPDLTAAAVTLVSSTTASLDAGSAPPSGGGIEVRWSDFGWGPANDQNLAGRFTTQTFTLPRLAKAQDYFLRQFDTSAPPKYSRYSAALHIDFPY